MPEVYAEMILTSGNVDIGILIESCHRMQHGIGMPVWATSVGIRSFKKNEISRTVA